MVKSKKIFKIAALALLVLVILFGFYKYKFLQDNQNQTVQTTKVARGDIENVVTATGNVTPKSYVDIGSQVSGQVMKLHVDVGDEVKIGDLLAEIDRTVLETKVESSKADLKYQEAQLKDRESKLKLAKINFGRQKELFDNDATSLEAYQNAEVELLSAEANIEMIKAQIAQTESSLKENQANLEYTLIYATMNGTVTSVAVKVGQTLNANQNTPTILTISDLKTVTISASVSEADIAKLKPETDVYFKTLGSANTWRTKVLKIEPTPSTSNNVVLYTVLFDVENESDELMMSMTTQVFFVLSSAKDTLLIPASAVKIDEKDKTKGTVYVQKNDKNFEPREISLGVNNRIQIEALSGLNENDNVATSYKTVINSSDSLPVKTTNMSSMSPMRIR